MSAASTLADRQRQMRERRAPVASIPRPQLVSPDFTQRHYSVAEVAKMWSLSADTTRRLFENEPGVLTLEGGGSKRTKYRTLRIPEHVVARVYRRQLSR